MQSCHYEFTRGSSHTVKALCSNCLPFHHKLCHSQALSFVPVSSCSVRLWRRDRRTQTALMGVDRWLPAAEASKVASLAYCISKTTKYTNVHLFQTSAAVIDLFFFGLRLTFWLCSWTFIWNTFFPSLKLWSLAPVDPPSWPLQGYKLSESKLYHEQIMEHDTLTGKSNTHTVTQITNTLKQKPKAADLSPFLYGLNVYYFLGVLLK